MALSMLNSMNSNGLLKDDFRGRNGNQLNQKNDVSSENSGSSISTFGSAKSDKYILKKEIRALPNSKEAWRDPRQGCCHGGAAFCDALKAMVTRLMFLLHTVIVTWRASCEHGVNLWYIAISYSLLLVETAVVLVIRKGKEWKW